MNNDERYITPVEYAKRLGVAPERVRAWIRKGTLRAVNVGDGVLRSRFRISPDAIAEFEERRSGKVPEPPPRQRRTDAKVRKYF